MIIPVLMNTTIVTKQFAEVTNYASKINCKLKRETQHVSASNSETHLKTRDWLDLVHHSSLGVIIGSWVKE